jgi:hypothetical protein
LGWLCWLPSFLCLVKQVQWYTKRSHYSEDFLEIVKMLPRPSHICYDARPSGIANILHSPANIFWAQIVYLIAFALNLFLKLTVRLKRVCLWIMRCNPSLLDRLVRYILQKETYVLWTWVLFWVELMIINICVIGLVSSVS